MPEPRERFELARDVAEERPGQLRGDEALPTEAAATFAAPNAAARDDRDRFRVASRRAAREELLAALTAAPSP